MTYIGAASRRGQLQGSLGLGYDTAKEEFAGPALVGLEPPEFVGTQESSLDWSRTVAESTVSNELGFTIGGKARFGVISAGMAANYAKSSVSNSASDTAIFRAQVGFKNVKLRLPAATLPFTAGALQAKGGSADLMIADADRWRETCGDEVVTQIMQGAALYFTVKLQYATQQEKEELGAEFNLAGPLFEASGKIHTASQSLSKRASVEVTAYQQGGDVAALYTAFNVITEVKGDKPDAKTHQYQALSVLSLDHPESITALLDSLVTYATREFPAQIEQTGTSSVKGPADLGYLTQPYALLGLTVAPPILQSAWAGKRQHLGLLFEELLNYAARVDSLLQADSIGAMHLSKRQRTKLQALSTDFNKALTGAANAAMVCYTKVEESPAAVDEFETSLHEPSTGVYRAGNFDRHADLEVEPETFRQWFDLHDKPTTTKAINQTLTAVVAKVGPAFVGFDSTKKNYGLENADVGEELEKYINQQTELDISGSGAADLQPIASFSNLKALNISGNKAISDLSPVRNLQALESLKFSNCSVSDITVLSSLPKLSCIMVSGNPIKNIKVLAGIPTLSNFTLTDDLMTWHHVTNSHGWLYLALRRDAEPWIFDAKVFDAFWLDNWRIWDDCQIEFAGIQPEGETRLLFLTQSGSSLGAVGQYRIKLQPDGRPLTSGENRWVGTADWFVDGEAVYYLPGAGYIDRMAGRALSVPELRSLGNR